MRTTGRRARRRAERTARRSWSARPARPCPRRPRVRCCNRLARAIAAVHAARPSGPLARRERSMTPPIWRARSRRPGRSPSASTAPTTPPARAMRSSARRPRFTATASITPSRSRRPSRGRIGGCASYSGDANNQPAGPTACGDPNETVVITPAHPAIQTVASGATVLGNPISDSATLSGGSHPTGTITFRVYGPDDSTCADSGGHLERRCFGERHLPLGLVHADRGRDLPLGRSTTPAITTTIRQRRAAGTRARRSSSRLRRHLRRLISARPPRHRRPRRQARRSMTSRT